MRRKKKRKSVKNVESKETKRRAARRNQYERNMSGIILAWTSIKSGSRQSRRLVGPLCQRVPSTMSL